MKQRGRSKAWVWAGMSVLACALAFATTAALAQEQAPKKAAGGTLTFDLAEMQKPWTGDLDGMIQRGVIRVLTVNEQVVGSSGKLKFELRDGKPVLVKLPELDFIDDKAGKPAGIQQHIGRRPILAFGNSDGDLQMLQWTAAGSGMRFMGLIHHTDGEREWAYGPESKIGTFSDALMAEAKKSGWTVVDMKKDWKRIFPYEKD